VTNRNPKRRPPAGYREPAAATQGTPPRRGFLDSILTPRPPGSTPMPRLRSTFARGVVTAISTPVLVFGVPAVLLLAWTGLLVAGFQGPFTLLAAVFAFPPVGTLVDTQLSGQVFKGGGLTAIGAMFGFVLVRSILLALVTCASVERLRTGRVSVWMLRRTPRVLPVTIAVSISGLAILIVGNILSAFLGQGLGLFGLVATLTAGVYLFAFVPTVAADEDRVFSDTMRRGLRVARMPGSSNLWLAVLYVLGSLALLLAAIPGSAIGVNPTPAAWVVSVVVNLLHVAVMATFSTRYLAVAALTPDAPPAPRPTRGRG
jgi:hypothetical protein